MNVVKVDKYPTKTQVEHFIKDGVTIYHHVAGEVYLTHINVKIGEGFARLELIATETDNSFGRVQYQQIRPYKKGFLLIESNKPDYFKQKQAVLNAYRQQIIPQLKREEQEIYTDSTVVETKHMIYEPQRLLLHYDGTKLTIKQFSVD
ncbi:MAG: hypothetical protein LH609_12115 [Rudanella sp.]|nr:hypothetical protein [Rudanella sp.]